MNCSRGDLLSPPLGLIVPSPCVPLPTITLSGLPVVIIYYRPLGSWVKFLPLGDQTQSAQIVIAVTIQIQKRFIITRLEQFVFAPQLSSHCMYAQKSIQETKCRYGYVIRAFEGIRKR